MANPESGPRRMEARVRATPRGSNPGGGLRREPRPGAYAAVHPPSTSRLCPVTYDDAGPARNTAAPTMSASVPNRPMGVWPFSAPAMASFARIPAVSGSGAQTPPGLDNDTVRVLDQAEMNALIGLEFKHITRIIAVQSRIRDELTP